MATRPQRGALGGHRPARAGRALENDRRGSNRVVGPPWSPRGRSRSRRILGLWGGYVGGVTDSLVMRWVDFMFALPGPLIAIVIVGVVGEGSGRPSRS